MRREWPEEATSFESTVRRALAGVGGADVARRAEADPSVRRATVLPLLETLGVRDLDPRADEGESAAAVLAVRASGAVALPWPIVHELAVPVADRSTWQSVHLGTERSRRLEHADLHDDVAVVGVTDRGVRRARAGTPVAAPLDPFGVDVLTEPADASLDAAEAWTTHHLLDAFWVSGAVRSVVRWAAVHAGEREQFGVPIARFGEIRWRLADLVVARDGLDELCLHTWWTVREGRATSADLLALRLAALETAAQSFTHAHQVLGAMGLCEEHDLAVVDRHLQPVLNRPGAARVTALQLGDAIRADGFAGTYPVAAWA